MSIEHAEVGFPSGWRLKLHFILSVRSARGAVIFSGGAGIPRS